MIFSMQDNNVIKTSVGLVININFKMQRGIKQKTKERAYQTTEYRSVKGLKCPLSIMQRCVTLSGTDNY